MKKFAIAAALVAGTFMGISAANANPIYIGYKVGGGALTVANSGTAGGVIFAGVDAISSVTFAITAFGSPTLSEPDLQTSEITINSPTAQTISVYITETDLTATPGILRFGFANNGLASSVDVAAYVQDCTVGPVCGTTTADDVFNTSNLVYSNTLLVGGGGGTADVAFPATVTGAYSQTLVYTFTLPAGGVSNANFSVTGVPVPEPLTLSLFGAGLAGMAAVRRRKQKKA